MKPILGIQLYTLRDHIRTAEDFDFTLLRLSKLGVHDVQISAIGDIPAETQRDILLKHGMRVCVTHKPFERMQNEIGELIREHEIIGCDAPGLGSCPSAYRGTEEGARAFISAVSAVADAFAMHGMKFHYHNHDFEFQKFPDSDKNLMDLLIGETDPDKVWFIPDLAWVHVAGYDPVEMLNRLRGRVKVIHFKDYILNEKGERKFVSLGKGRVDLAACYRAACALEIPYIVYEQDCDWTDGDPFKSTEESWTYMKELEKKEWHN